MFIRKLFLAILVLIGVLALLPMNANPAQASGNCNGVLHTVQIGENLYRISLRYGVSLAAIASANGISNYSLIYAGSVLCIPGTSGATTPVYPPNTYPGVVIIPVTVVTYPTYPTYPTVPVNYPTTITNPNTTGTFFRSCILGVECRPDQTQYMYVNGREVCVAAKYTANGLGWVETDRIWCRWIDIFRGTATP